MVNPPRESFALLLKAAYCLHPATLAHQLRAMTPKYANYSSINIVQEEPEPAFHFSRINKRNALVALVALILGLSLAVGHDRSPFFLYGPLLGPYLDGDGARGRRKAVKALLNLQDDIEGTIYFQNSAEFCQASQVWQQNVVDTPLAVIEVASEADVQLAVPILADIYLRRGVPFRVRSGGHSYAGYSTIQRGIVLSLQRLNHYDFDESTGIITVQPAVRVQDLLDGILLPKGFGGVVGECPGVAESGFVLGKWHD